MAESLYIETESYSWLKLDNLSAVPIDEVWVFEMKTYWGTADATRPKFSLTPYFGSKPLYKFRQHAFYDCSIVLFKETGLGHEVDLDVNVTLADPINYMKAIETKGLHIKDTESLLKEPLKAALEQMISLQPEQLATQNIVSPFAAQDLKTGVLHHLLSSPDISLYIQNNPDFQSLGVEVQVSVNNIFSSLTYQEVLRQATYELNSKMPFFMRWLKNSVPFQMDKELTFRQQVYTHVIRYYNIVFSEISPILANIIIRFVSSNRVREAVRPIVISALFKDLLRQELEKIKRTTNNTPQQRQSPPLQEQAIPRNERANTIPNVYPSIRTTGLEEDSVFIPASPQRLAELGIPPTQHISQTPTLQFERPQVAQQPSKRTINKEEQPEAQIPHPPQKQQADAAEQRTVQELQPTSPQQALPQVVEQHPAQPEQALPQAVEQHSIQQAPIAQQRTTAPRRYTQQDLEILRHPDEELPDPFIPDEQFENTHNQNADKVAQQLLTIQGESHELVKMLAESNKTLTQQFASSNTELAQRLIEANKKTAQQLANMVLQILQQGTIPTSASAATQNAPEEAANTLMSHKLKIPPIPSQTVTPLPSQRPADLTVRQLKLPPIPSKRTAKAQPPKTSEGQLKARELKRPPIVEKPTSISGTSQTPAIESDLVSQNSSGPKTVPLLKSKRPPLKPLIAEKQDGQVNKNISATSAQRIDPAQAAQNPLVPAQVTRLPLPEYMRDTQEREERWGAGLEGHLKALYEAQLYEGWKISPSIQDILEKMQAQEGDIIDGTITIYIDIGDTFRVWVSVSSQYPKERPLIEIIHQTVKLPQEYVHSVLNPFYKGGYDLYKLVKALMDDVHSRKW